MRESLAGSTAALTLPQALRLSPGAQQARAPLRPQASAARSPCPVLQTLGQNPGAASLAGPSGDPDLSPVPPPGPAPSGSLLGITRDLSRSRRASLDPDAAEPGQGGGRVGKTRQDPHRLRAAPRLPAPRRTGWALPLFQPLSRSSAFPLVNQVSSVRVAASTGTEGSIPRPSLRGGAQTPLALPSPFLPLLALPPTPPSSSPLPLLVTPPSVPLGLLVAPPLPSHLGTPLSLASP